MSYPDDFDLWFDEAAKLQDEINALDSALQDARAHPARRTPWWKRLANRLRNARKP